MNIPELTTFVSGATGAISGVAVASGSGLPVQFTAGTAGLLLGLAVGMVGLVLGTRFKKDGEPIPSLATPPVVYFLVIVPCSIAGSVCVSVVAAKLLLLGLDAF